MYQFILRTFQRHFVLQQAAEVDETNIARIGRARFPFCVDSQGQRSTHSGHKSLEMFSEAVRGQEMRQFDIYLPDLQSRHISSLRV